MRVSLLSTFLTIALASTVIAAPPRKAAGRTEGLEDDESAADSTSADKSTAGKSPINDAGKEVTAGSAETGTTFNGIDVPEMTALGSGTIDDSIAKGYWLVEFFSPYCHHCKAFAPTWQTLYEFYYTSAAAPGSESSDPTESLNSFTRYYDFHFAKVDCVANGDACSDPSKKINSFPTVVLFKDGEQVKSKVGAQDFSTMSKWIEETLESVRPGSRSQDRLTLPKAGDDHVEVSKGRAKDSLSGVPAGMEKDSFEDELVERKATATKTKAALQATRLPKETPNPAGRSTPLTAENFQRLVTTTQDSWFVKFYAPWCHHCQAMAPGWQAMARDMRGKLNIGEVNCETDKRLCKDVRVKGYPTLLYFQNGERIEYEGLRGVGDLLKFANQAASATDGLREVDAAEFEALEKNEEVIFLYMYDHATTTEDFQALERLTLSLIGHAKIVKTNDPLLYRRFKISTWPRLLVSRDGKPTYYTALAPKDMRDVRRVLGWMQTVWQPIVPELTASNAREIMDGKLVVLGILSRERADEFVIAKREIKNAALEWIDKQTQAYQLERQELRDAKQLRIEEAEDRNDQRSLRSAKQIRINMDDIERKEVTFAWVDGTFWERWIKTTFGINVKDGERVVVNDEANHRYWDSTITGNPIVPSRTSILETLPKIVANPPKLSPKSTASFLGHVWYSLRGGVIHHPFLSAGFAIGMLIAVAIWGRGLVRRVNGNFNGTGKDRWGSGGFLSLPITSNGKDGGVMNGFLGNGAANGGKTD